MILLIFGWGTKLSSEISNLDFLSGLKHTDSLHLLSLVFFLFPQPTGDKNHPTSLDPAVVTANILVHFLPDWIYMYSQISKQYANRPGFHGIYFIT